MSVTQELVRNILDTPFEKFDVDTVERARERIIDVVGCMIGGAYAPGCSMLLDLIREWGGREEATVIVHGVRLPAHNASLMTSIMARSYDFEPVCPIVDGISTPAHISGTTVPTALAVAEAQSSSGKDLLAALILGDDLTSRTVAASNTSLDSGFEPTGIANVFGATAIAGKLMGLNEQQMANALGIALNQLSGTFQNIFDGAHTFKLPQGLAARGGIFSAALARKGFTGVKDVFFSKYGYFSLFSKTCRPDLLTKDLGAEFYADMTLKPYPCSRSTHAAIDGVLSLVHNNPIQPEDVKEVVIDVPPETRDFAVGQPFKIRNVPQIDAGFSLQYTVASALCRKGVKLEHFSKEAIVEPKVMEIVKKIRFTAHMPPENPLSAAVKIRTRQGREYETRIDVPRGNSIFTPLTPRQKKEKFLANAEFSGAMRSNEAEVVWNMLRRIEEVGNVTDIVRLLAGPKKGPPKTP
jgi:2-methylcitrate dehydratase PrpD